MPPQNHLITMGSENSLLHLGTVLLSTLERGILLQYTLKARSPIVAGGPRFASPTQRYEAVDGNGKMSPTTSKTQPRNHAAPPPARAPSHVCRHQVVQPGEAACVCSSITRRKQGAQVPREKSNRQKYHCKCRKTKKKKN